MKITVLGLLGNSVFLSVPNFHRPGETVRAEGMYCEPGGKGSNQAVAAARLGAETAFISCMGDDQVRRECMAFMENEGIKCFTETTDKANSPYAAILTDPEGENQVTVYRGSADFISPEFIRSCEETIAESDILLLNNECPYEANLAALDIAEKYNIPAILNPAPYACLPLDYFRRFYLITPNRHEALSLLGMDEAASPEEIIRAFNDRGFDRAVVTMGAEGAAGFEGDRMYLCPAIKSAAVDTTGAGDCFNGALAVSIAQGKTLPEAMETAVNASAISVRKKFVMPSLPTPAELKDQWTDLSITVTKVSR